MRNCLNHRSAVEALRGSGCLRKIGAASFANLCLFWRVPRGVRLGLPLLAALGLFLFSLQDARSQQIWLAIRSPNTLPHSVADWDALFRPTPEWAAVASRINIFGIGVAYVLKATDQELVAIAAELQRRQIGLSVALQSIARTASDTCGNPEGYGVESEHARAAAKLHRLGITPRYLALDEPIWFGHFSTDPLSCRFTLEELARRVSANVEKYVALLPDVTLGDIEPIPVLILQPDWQTSTSAFYHALKASTGEDVTFLHTDVAWRVPGWAEALKAVKTFSRDSNLKFGVIYNGDEQDSTGRTWVSDAIRHFEKLESQPTLIPDNAVFASWNNYPTRALPETSDETLSHVVASYSRPGTFFRLTKTPDGIAGQLLRDVDHPVAAAQVVLSRMGLDLTKPMPPQIAAGQVPAGARSAIIGIRVNMECFCRGNNDISVGDIKYSEAATGLTANYSLADVAERQTGRPSNGIRPTLQAVGDRRAAHITVPADQHFGSNSPQFPVTPGASFRFEVPIGSESATGLYGSIILIWLNQDGKGIIRTMVTLGSDAEASLVAAAQTNREGEFRFVTPANAGFRIRMTFPGSSDLRAADVD
jgi:hypothetical protein